VHEIDRITISDGIRQRCISFWQGNPAEITQDDPVDLIIVSAFQNNYTPTQWSIIGALFRRGVNVSMLAEDKEIDLRKTAGFWLSRSLSKNAPVGAGRILCFEPGFLGAQPAEVVGYLFRGLFPFLPTAQDSTVAMAVIGTGALGEDPARMLRALVTAATEWMKRGLPIRELRIMEQNVNRAKALAPVFSELKALASPAPSKRASAQFDVLLSFSKADVPSAEIVSKSMREKAPRVRLFDYRFSINPGEIWQDEIDQAMQNCEKMVALLSPNYFASPECREELTMARLRHKRSEQPFLLPIYLRSLENNQELPLWLQAINYVDCREADPKKLNSAGTSFT
jgi:hypothetical protein